MKGQLTIQGIMIAVLTILVLGMFAPLLYQVINSLNGNASINNDTTTPVISSLIVPLLVIGVALVPVLYTLAGQRQRNNE